MSPVDPFEDENFDEGLAEDDEPESTGAEAEPELYFASLELFVDWLLDTYRRSTLGPQRIWCPEWWRHPEALARLDALWRAFEHLRLDPALGMSMWWRDHADHHMVVLMDPDGPLKGCNVRDGHAKRPVAPLEHEPVPAGLLDHETHSGAGDVDDDEVPRWASAPAAPSSGGYSRASELRVGENRSQEHRRR